MESGGAYNKAAIKMFPYSQLKKRPFSPIYTGDVFWGRTVAGDVAPAFYPRRVFRETKLRVLAFYILAPLLFSSLCPKVLWAQLGQSEDYAIRQMRSFNLENSQPHLTPTFRYIEFSSSKLTIRQYINPETQTVFGITWKGTRMPSLTRLLGFDPQQITGTMVRRSLHSAHIRTDILTIDLIDILGHHAGRALRTDLLPKGVSAEAITP